MLPQDRRAFLKLSGLAGVAFASALFPGYPASAQAADFHFIQFSATHWGYKGPANPDAEHTLEKAVATVNTLPNQRTSSSSPATSPIRRTTRWSGVHA
jgi:hypothetical protein